MKQSNLWNEFYRSGNTWKLQTKSLPSIMKDKIALELGVGNGKTLQAILNQEPKKVVALDFSSEALKIIEKEFPQIQAVKSSIISLPFRKKSFDVVVCYFTLNNLLKEQREKTVEEILRILKPRGILLFQDFQEGDFRQKGKSVEKNTIEKTNGLICHFFTPSEVRSLFSKFRSLKIESISSRPITYKPGLKRKVLLARAVK